MRRARATAFVLALATGCEPKTPEIPPGTHIFGSTAEISELLGDLSRFQDAPIARISENIRSTLANCQQFYLHKSTDGFETKCEIPDGLQKLSAPGSAVTAIVDLGSPGQLILRGQRTTTGFELEGPWPKLAKPVVGPVQLFVPSSEPAGPYVLAGAEALIHVRARPESGIALDQLVQSKGQGATLFRLKSAVFSSAALDGTWELAAYPPSPKERLPKMALAIGVRSRQAAAKGFEEYIEDVKKTWSVTASPYSNSAGSGQCLLNLNIMPDLAPCYVVTERALVLGWNPSSLDAAFRSPPPNRTDSAISFQISAFPAADHIFDSTANPSRESQPMTYPFKSLEARVFEKDGTRFVSVRLERAP